jgi:hypothetical protein
LPSDFHSSNSFSKTLTILKKAFSKSSDLDEGDVDAPLLLMGLMYREVCRAVEVEEGAPTNAPDYLANSSFGIRELNRIESLINNIKLPSHWS